MKKIMFNDKYGLTQAVLEGRKTMTRRDMSIPTNLATFHKMKSNGNALFKVGESYDFVDAKPLYGVGEVVAIAQSYKSIYDEADKRDYWDGRYEPFRNIKAAGTAGWKNKMFVRADAMPHHIRITGIKVERLQDITEEDCLKEGIHDDTPQYERGKQYSFNSTIGYCGQYPFETPRQAFAALIDKVSGKGTWDSNPYVFAYSFELID